LPAADDHSHADRPGPPAAALAELRAGNSRFVSGTPVHPHQDAAHRAAVARAQTPYATVLGCSDSRLAPEIIFDQGLGDLFVVRTAGHALGSEVLGSVEYAVTVLETPLVVVLGHSSCGAVLAASTAVSSGELPAGHLGELVASMLPSVRLASERGITSVDGIVDVHIERTARELFESSPVLAEAVGGRRCTVVGMSYALTDGRVRLLASDAEDQSEGQAPRSR
jgi:carbonic anhydrase